MVPRLHTAHVVLLWAVTTSTLGNVTAEISFAHADFGAAASAVISPTAAAAD